MRAILKSIIFPVLVVFFAVMVVVVISFFMARNSVKQELNDTVGQYTRLTEGSTSDRLNLFEETLRAGVGLFAGDSQLTKNDWEKYIQASTVLKRYKGAQTVAYAKVVYPGTAASFTEAAKTTINPAFRIFPEGSRDVYTPIIYVAPPSPNGEKSTGFDITSEEIRRKAVISARDSGEISLSDTVQSVIDTANTNKFFIAYAPQYTPGLPTDTVMQRQVAIQGYVFVAFNIEQFMHDVTANEDDHNIAFSVSVNDNKTPMYMTDNFDSIKNSEHEFKTDKVKIGSSTLTFSYVYQPNEVLPVSVSSRPWAILIFGVLTSLLISGAVWLLLRGRANQLLLDKERSINDAKDDLLSLASHQLRTPATGVKQYLGLLLQGFSGKLDPKQKTLLEKAYAGNERQLKTINDVLYLARLGSGRIVLSRSMFSPGDSIKDIINELHDDIAQKGHKVTLNMPKHLKQYYGDEHMIRMGVENLITNSIKYTHNKGKITVKLIQGKNELKISVQDNGVGIAPNQQERMFEQFERIENDLSIASGGSGIGLYVVSVIADLHGGHIEVTSDLGRGSKFTLVLPYGSEVQSDKV